MITTATLGATRQQLIDIYLDWRNNYLGVELFAEHRGLHVGEAIALIELCRICFENKHPDA